VVRPFFLVIFFWTLERLCGILTGLRLDGGENPKEFYVYAGPHNLFDEALQLLRAQG